MADVCTTAVHWVPLRDPADLWPAWARVDQAARLRVLADAYGLTDVERARLVELGLARADRTWLLMKGAAEHWGGGWARTWDAGVGDRRRCWQAWLSASGDALTSALVT